MEAQFPLLVPVRDTKEGDLVMADPIGAPAPFSPELSASKALQAEHGRTDDSPVDVNLNAILARFMGQTTALSGAEFGAAAARRTIFADVAVQPPALRSPPGT